MLDLRNGQANKTHLETSEDRAQKQRKVSVRGEGGKERGEDLRGAVQLQSVVAMPIYTPTQTETQTNPCHSSCNHARLISYQSLCPANPRGVEKGKEMDEEMVVKLQPSIISLPKLLCAMAS